MITKEQIKKAQEDLSIAMIPARQAFENAQKEMQKTASQLSTPLIELIEQYYDEQLLDVNGNTVKEGDVVMLNKRKFLVVDRSMQVIFSELMFNPSVTLSYLGSQGKGKGFKVHSRELKDYEIEKKS